LGCHRPPAGRIFAAMTESPPDSPSGRPGAIVARAREPAVFSPPPAAAMLTAEGAAALEAAQELARSASAPATRRAYKADWTHFSAWCAEKSFVPVPAAPEVVGAYLASLAATHAPATIRRRLSALGKMHRYNDLPWNAAHGAIQGPLQGLLRQHGSPPQKAAALSLAMLRQLLTTCDRTARGRRDRALLLFGFAGALRRSELVSLRVEDVVVDANGLRLRILRGKTDQEEQGAEIGLPRGRHAETCPLRAFEDWQAVAQRKAGPLFRKVTASGRVEPQRLTGTAARR
jgi:integrase